MFAKISLKKLTTVLLGVFIIGALTNCGGSGGGGSAAPAAKKASAIECMAGEFFVEGACKSSIVFTSPAVIAAASSCEGDLALEVTLNEQKECLSAEKQAIDFILTSTVDLISTAEGRATSWPNTDVTVALATKNANLEVTNCTVKNVSQDVASTFTADFSSQFSCDVLARSTADDNQRTYKINIVHGISEAADFKNDFFANAAARFVLTKDITLTAEATSFARSFKGQLDGANHEIKELSIAVPGGADQVGLISEIALSPDDSMVEIKNLTLGIIKLAGNKNVGGLIGRVGGEGAQAVQIKNVTVKFAASAELKCRNRCGGLVGEASTAVHFSDIQVTGGEVSTSGFYLGGVVGGANAGMRLINVHAHFNITHSDGSYVGLVAGDAKGNSILRDIDASGHISCTETCTRIGGIVGWIQDSQLSQAKSSLLLTVPSAGTTSQRSLQQIGGVVARSSGLSPITAVYGKLSTIGSNADKVGSIVGLMEGGLLEKAVGYVDVQVETYSAGGAFGGLIGSAPQGRVELKQVFAAGAFSVASGTSSSDTTAGQMIGLIEGELTADNCYTGAFTGATIPDEAVGQITASASFTKCYTRADKFVADDDVSKVVFETVYATNAQAGGKPKADSAEDTSVTVLPDTFDLLPLNGSDGTLWTKTYGVTEYKYPMLAYPTASMAGGPISEADWFEFQIIDNEKK